MSRPCVPNHWMNEIAASSDGARIGVSAMTRNVRLNGMQLRVSAYAKVNASGIVMAVTASATDAVCRIDCCSAGVWK